MVETREAWLNRAVEVFRPRFVEVGLPLPERVNVSVGFPDGFGAEGKRTMAVCLFRKASTGGVNEIFISPEYDSAHIILAVLLHELIHAADNNESGHRGAFAYSARSLGLAGKMTEANPGPELAADLKTVAGQLGEYPHTRTRLFEVLAEAKAAREEFEPADTSAPAAPGADGPRITSGRQPQKTHMKKLICPNEDGFSVRTTAKMLAIGYPSCPCGTVMIDA